MGVMQRLIRVAPVNTLPSSDVLVHFIINIPQRNTVIYCSLGHYLVFGKKHAGSNDTVLAGINKLPSRQ